jgi:UDP-N-acetylglucosamine 2-epimerase
MKIVSLVDSYSDLIHAAAVSRALRRVHQEVLVYTGPHVGFSQARAYFEHLTLFEPEVNLEVGSSTTGATLGDLLVRLERALFDLRPDLVIVRGHSATTLAGALAAARQSMPVARLDAGVRAYRKSAPGELTNVLVDHLADVLFCNTRAAVQRLAEEGVVAGVHFSGDTVLDAVEHYRPAARLHSTILQRAGLYRGCYLLAVIQHPDRTSQADYLINLVKAFRCIREPIILPMAPQTRLALERMDVTLPPHVLPLDPIGYLDRLTLAENARAIITDTGSLQREAYCLAVPCITVRDETEVSETVDVGWNQLAGCEVDRIVAAVHDFLPPLERPPLFGSGDAAERIADVLNARPVAFGQNYNQVAASLQANFLAI